MNCKTCQDIALAGTLNELSPAEVEAFHTHRSECAGCFRVADELRSFTSALAQLTPVTPPERVWNSLEKRLAQRFKRQAHRPALDLRSGESTAGLRHEPIRSLFTAPPPVEAVAPDVERFPHDAFADAYFRPAAVEQPAEQLSDQQSLEVIAIWANSVIATISNTELKQKIRVGETKECQIFVPGAFFNKKSYTLVSGSIDSPRLNLAHPELDGELLVDGRIVPLSQLRAEGRVKHGRLVIPPAAKCRLYVGPLTLLINYSRMSRPPTRRLWQRIDWPITTSNTISLAAHLLFLLAVLLIPHKHLKLHGDDPFQPQAGDFQALIEVRQPGGQDELEMELEQHRPSGVAKNQQLTDKKRSKIGPKKADNKGKTGPTPTLALRKDKKSAMKKGIAAALLSRKLRSLYSDEKLSPRPGRLSMLGVLGSRGPGRAVPGYEQLANNLLPPERTTPPLGRPGSNGVTCMKLQPCFKGIRSGTISGHIGFRSGVKGLWNPRKTKRPAVTVFSGTMKKRGKLAGELIQRVIRRHYNQFRFCYEQQLILRPKLGGKLALSFTISPTGQVLSPSISASELRNPAMERCIVRAISRVQFPTVADQGVVTVEYPLVFRSVRKNRPN